jgi:hypothetical protein
VNRSNTALITPRRALRPGLAAAEDAGRASTTALPPAADPHRATAAAGAASLRPAPRAPARTDDDVEQKHTSIGRLI